jgi:alginate O-acetyltransferase complex protein AlgI
MVFSSTVFLFLFLPITLAVYFLLPRVLRNTWLLVASLFFYAWGERAFVFVMLASNVANYLFGLLVHAFRGKSQAKLVLAFSVAANLGLLLAYKYANFLVDGVLNPALSALHFSPWHLAPVHLPIGISFFTFHAISYVVDVYRGHARAQRNPLNFALYEALFPQLVAGPIIRYQDIADRIDERRETLGEFAYGIHRFVIGLSKKVLIANVLAVQVDKIFAIHPRELPTSVAWLGAIFYALQIYFDFSGYSDMAVGLGHMFGFRFVENFNYPYISGSIQEFWRRWHISLSTWFRDYLYIPLGGNRVSPGRVYFNLLIVFLLCGLWHGASWNFVIWGSLHGLFLIIERKRFLAWLDRVWWPVRHAYALLVVLIGWVFFRAENLTAALSFLRAMAGFSHGNLTEFYPALFLDSATLLALAAGVIGSMPVIPKLADLLARKPHPGAMESALGFARLGLLSALFLLCAVQLAAGTYNPFIYFRF